MAHLNVEIKARCEHPERVSALLKDRGARFEGIDSQTDTYFRCPHGRLKLREGRIENALIHYHRPEQAGPKPSDVILLPTEPGSPMKEILAAALGILVVVRKKREIHFIDNVKFHVDAVEGLGSFVEIEAIDAAGRIGRDALDRQCRQYVELLGIRRDNLLEASYSDMLLARREDGG